VNCNYLLFSIFANTQLTGVKSFKENGNMANAANPNDIIPLREALHMEITINQALIDLLVSKGIITQEELMQKIEEIRKEQPVSSTKV
jgi:hypothetical protein